MSVESGLKKAGALGKGPARAHLFLCLGPECCSLKEGKKVWDYLKEATAELEKKQGILVLRTKADCLRVCSGGPWLVVYPEGTWYGDVTVERCARILEEHVVGGRPVEKWAAATQPLTGCEKKDGA
ncbi:MAG: (2Fe-2S) ferredoxin domain-containing protein [Verrucomicrobium sp.]|nr:(2Fe-2S) ferredoxin domain-containing protein [Verrucomicrobium sp.]